MQLGLAVEALQLSAGAQGSTSVALMRLTGGAGLPLQAHPQGGVILAISRRNVKGGVGWFRSLFRSEQELLTGGAIISW